MVEEHYHIINKFFTERHLHAIKFDVLKLPEAAVRQILSLRRCSMLGDLVIVHDWLNRSILCEDEKIARTVFWYECDEEQLADFSEPNERAKMDAGIHCSYVEDVNATVVSSAENASTEQVHFGYNGLTGCNIPVATQTTLSTQKTTTSSCYSSTPFASSALGKPHTQGCAWSDTLRSYFRLRTAVAASAAMRIFFSTAYAGFTKSAHRPWLVQSRGRTCFWRENATIIQLRWYRWPSRRAGATSSWKRLVRWDRFRTPFAERIWIARNFAQFAIALHE